MLPDQVLSSIGLVADLLPPRDRVRADLVDYELGGVALNDTSEPLDSYVWRGEVRNDTVYLRRVGQEEISVFQHPGIFNFSFTFDQNMNPFIAFETFDGVSAFYWYDTTIQGYNITTLPARSKSPRAVLDDKRSHQISVSDIIIAYIRDNNLYARIQRDRYETEYQLISDLDPDDILDQIGMGTNWRLHFRLKQYSPPEIPTTSAIVAHISDGQLFATNTFNVQITLNRALNPGERVRYSVDSFVGQARKINDLEYRFQVQNLEDGEHRLSAWVFNSRGYEGPVDSKKIIIDTTAPDGVVEILAFTDEEGTHGSGESTTSNTITIYGTADADDGEVVVLYENGIELVSIVPEDGQWSYLLENLPENTYTYNAHLRDLAGNDGALSNNFTVTITEQDVTVELSGTLGDWSIGNEYSQSLTATGGDEDYTWSVSEGELPPGLSLDTSTGVISGTPTVGGTYDFTIHVEDGEGLEDSSAQSVEIVEDPDWAKVELLLQFDGTDGSTTITDSSVDGREIAVSGDAHLDTAQSKFGGSSLRLDGNGDYISTAHSSDFSVDTGDFTIEAWVRLNETGRVQVISSKRDTTSTEEHEMTIDSSNVLTFAMWDNGVVRLALVGTTALTTGNWYHVAACREGSDCYLFLDGVLEASDTQTGAPNTNTQALIIGRNVPFAPGRDFNGWIDEYRFTKGLARYTEPFTPPVAPFPKFVEETFNQNDAGPGLTFSNGDKTIERKISGNDSPNYANASRSKRGRSSGKVYVEFTVGRDANKWGGYFGICRSSAALTSTTLTATTAPLAHDVIMLLPSSGDISQMRVRDQSTTSVLYTPQAGDGAVHGVAIDFDEGKLWFMSQGKWLLGSGAGGAVSDTFDEDDPTTTFTPGDTWMLYGESPFSGTAVTMNSGPTFTYTPPDGFGYW